MKQLTNAMQAFAQQTEAINQLRNQLTRPEDENRLLRQRQPLSEKPQSA